ncbi:MAG: DNRLRE domain-containing protein [Gammaproteobacteria bacterium]|nr:DNRLRE domain-containing protein [Gammaproteobacteria bacterium]
MSGGQLKQPRGFILLPVVLAITLIAAIAFLMNRSGAIQINMADAESQAREAQYLAEAGLQHALWMANNNNCENYALASTNFGDHSYSASFTPTSGSPVTLSAVGTLTNGVTRTLSRNLVSIYQPSEVLVLQPDASDGKDAEVWQQQPANNYGTEDVTWVSRNGTDVTRTLLEFDVSTIPGSAKVLSATLSLHHKSGSGSGVPVTAHRITNSWNEDFVSWNSRENGTNWATAGVDFDSTVIATTNVGPASNTRYEWDIASLVQDWINGGYPNHGVVLSTALAGAAGEQFETSDHSNAARHPSLTITYACECGVVCTTVSEVTNGNVLFLVDKSNNLSKAETVRQSLLESWGYTVNLLSDDSSQTDIDAALSENDVVYISETVLADTVGKKLSAASIGVVYEEYRLDEEFGLSDASVSWPESDLIITDNSHYITQPFLTGALTLFDSVDDATYLYGNLASGLQTLGTFQGDPGLALVEKDASLLSGTASGRRVQLPWGESDDFDFEGLTEDGETILRRSLLWASENPLSCENESSETIRISTGSDDAEEYTTNQNMYLDSTDLEFGYDSEFSSDMIVGLRFDSVNIPPGSRVIGAYIDMVIDETSSIATSVSFSAEASDNALTFSSVSSNLSSRIRTSASIDWSEVPSWSSTGDSVTSPDLAGMVQEVVDRPGWVKGSAIAIIAEGSGLRTAESYDGSSGKAPALRLYYCSTEAEPESPEPSLDPIAHWNLDEGSGTTATDSEGGHDGTLTNGPNWTSSGQVDGAVDFDGSNDRIIVPHSTELSISDAITISAWVNNQDSSLSSSYRIVSKEQSGQNDGYWMALSGSTLYLGIGGNFFSASTSVSANQWHHLTATFDDAANTVALYVDGIVVSTSSTSATMNTNTAQLEIGNNWESSKLWNGLLDDVRIYNRALDGSEISALVSGGGGSASGVVFESFSDNTLGSNGTSLTIDKPSGTQAMELLIAFVVTDGNTASALADQAGWEKIEVLDESAAITFGSWWKLAGSSEPASYTFSWSGSQEAYGMVMRFSGHDSSDPLNKFEKATGTSSQPLSPEITTDVANTLILRLGGFDDDDINSGSTGLSAHTDIDMAESRSGTGTVSGGAGYTTQSESGDSGIENFSLTASEQYITFTIGIAPEP